MNILNKNSVDSALGYQVSSDKTLALDQGSNGVFSKYLAKCNSEKSSLYSNVSDHSLLLNLHAWQFVQSVLCGTKIGL